MIAYGGATAALYFPSLLHSKTYLNRFAAVWTTAIIGVVQQWLTIENVASKRSAVIESVLLKIHLMMLPALLRQYLLHFAQ